jgi:hypothetical protein
MAPEVVGGQGYDGRKSDCFSAAMVILCLVFRIKTTTDLLKKNIGSRNDKRICAK